MDKIEIARQMIAFNKIAFDNILKAMTILEAQTEKIVFPFMDKASWLTDDGKKAMIGWMNAYKKGLENFKKYTDESYKKAADYFAEASKE